MVMPFRRRKVEGSVGEGAPPELDCDALWDRAFRPAIEALGYLPVRADAESGSVIVKDMLERLAFAHLVLADVSLPNGNVYYEVGLRHVACKTGAILLAASWSRQLFDIDQFRTVRYPLQDGLVPDTEAAAIRDLLHEAIPRLRDAVTPWHEFIDPATAGAGRLAFREQSEATSALQGRMRAARLASKDERQTLVRSLLDDIQPATLGIPEIASELLILVRDALGWTALLEFTGRLPAGTRHVPFVREQELLALAETGQPLDAIGRLEMLVAEQGDTPERQGLIGGRYKRLWRTARQERIGRNEQAPSADERRFLNKAIDHYTRGMDLDLNQYYCSCNLPQLLRARARTGDADRAMVIDQFVVAACDRALKRGEHDEWLRPTLLGAAFRARDVQKAEELAAQIEDEGAVAWKLESSLSDLRTEVQASEGHDSHDALAGIYERLEQLTE